MMKRLLALSALLGTLFFGVPAMAQCGGGDLVPGPLPDTCKVVGIQGKTVSPAAPANGQALIWSSTANAWVPTATSGTITVPVTVANGGTGLTSLTANALVIGNNTSNVKLLGEVDGDCAVGAGGVWTVGSCGGGGTGTVTSVALTLPNIFSISGSPVTTAGTLTGTLATELANTIFSGPTTGAAAAPTFRALVAADVTAGVHGMFGSTGTLNTCYGQTSGGVDELVACPSASGSGTVTSAAFTGDGVVYNATVTGSPITTSGTFAPTLHTQTANTIFAGPTTGSAAAPTFRSLVAADVPLSTLAVPSSDVIMGNGSGVGAAVSLSQDIGCVNTGVCTVTGLQGRAVSSSAPSSTNVLAWNGSAWAPAAASSGSLTVNGVTPVSTISLGPNLTTTGTTPTVTLAQTNPVRNPTDGGSHSYAVQTTCPSSTTCDVGYQVNLVSTFTAMTVPQATGSFAEGACFSLSNAGAITATATTSTINGIAGATGLKLGANGGSVWCAANGNWTVQIGSPTPATQSSTTFVATDGSIQTPSGSGNMVGTGASTTGNILQSNTTGTPLAAATDGGFAITDIGRLSTAQTYSGAKSFGEVHGTASTPSFTTNVLSPTTASCGETLKLTNGAAGAVHLPNNANPASGECSIKFIVTDNFTYTFTAPSGTIVSGSGCTGITSARQHAQLIATLETPSASAAQWDISGDCS
jgi:hypothetical protein